MNGKYIDICVCVYIYTCYSKPAQGYDSDGIQWFLPHDRPPRSLWQPG